jgi:hypothetical protein
VRILAPGFLTLNADAIVLPDSAVDISNRQLLRAACRGNRAWLFGGSFPFIRI